MGKILHISEAASLAIHSMVLIAGSPSRLNVNTIALLTHSSRNHLAKVMQQLVRNNYLASGRGPGGGFMMKQDPAKVTLLEIYELIDGAVQMHFCGIESGKCPFNSCVFGGLTEKLTEEFAAYLGSRKLSDFVKEGILPNALTLKN